MTPSRQIPHVLERGSCPEVIETAAHPLGPIAPVVAAQKALVVALILKIL